MTARNIDAAVAALAATQASCFSRNQARAAGATTSLVDRRVARGAWAAVAPGVYSLPGHRPSYERRLWIALLAASPSAIVSHEAAAYLHRISGVPREPIVVTIPHPGHLRVDGATVHQTSDPWPLPTTRRHGLPVTTIERTFVDLAATTRLVRLGPMLEDAVAARRTTFAKVEACRAAVDRPGKRGLIGLGAAIAAYADGPPVSRSVLERELHRLVERAGLPALTRQFFYPGQTEVDGCADGAWSEVRQLVETDGRRHHQRRAEMALDRERDAAAQRMGWNVLRLMYEHVVGDPEWTIGLLRDVYRVRRLQAG